MMILGLNTLGIIIETGLGIWIFSKAFPRRAEDEWGWKEVVNEGILHFEIWIIILHNFVDVWSIGLKYLFVSLWLALLFVYRQVIIKQCLIPVFYRKGINRVLLAFEFFTMIGILAWNYWLGYISLPMVWTANMMLPFFYKKYSRCKFFQAYLWEVLYLVVIQIVKCAFMFYEGAAEHQTMLIMNRNGGMHTYSAVLFPIIVYAFIFILVKSFSIYDILAEILNVHRWIVLSMVIFINVILYYFTDIIGTNRINVHAAQIIESIAVIMAFVIFVLLITLFKKSMLAEQRLLSVRNSAIEQQYQELRKAYEQNRCLVHDEKHRMQYIGECLENGDLERARDFIKKSCGEMQSEKHRLWTGLSSLDFIINTKNVYIEEYKIDFQLQAKLSSIPIQEEGFVVLLGNLLDNAIEATIKCPEDRRSIKLHLSQINNMFLLLLKNTSTAVPMKRKMKFVTTKTDTSAHGYGIESVKHIVEKYQGEINFDYDEVMFQVRIHMTTD